MKLGLVVLAVIASQIACRSREAKVKDAEAHYNRGMELLKKDGRDGAVAEFREAVRLKPDDADAHSNLGAALERKGDREGALREKHNAAEIRLGHELPPRRQRGSRIE